MPGIMPPVRASGATGRTSFSRRSRVIWRCCSAASASSVAGSLSRRTRRASSISCALLPVALIRKTFPNRSSYSRLAASSARRTSSLVSAVPVCSLRAHAEPPPSPIRGCAANASRRSSADSPAHTSSEVVEQRVEVGERPSLLQPLGPRARAAAREHPLLEQLGRLGVQPADAERTPAVVGHPPVHAEPSHPAVGMDVQPDLGRRRRRVDRERDTPMRAELATREDLGPCRLGLRVGGDVGRDTDVERAGVRVVALEVRRVDLDAFDLRSRRPAEPQPSRGPRRAAASSPTRRACRASRPAR